MRATVRLPDTGAWVRRGPPAVSAACTLMMRYRLELLWAAFAAANYAAMLAWPDMGDGPVLLHLDQPDAALRAQGVAAAADADRPGGDAWC